MCRSRFCRHFAIYSRAERVKGRRVEVQTKCCCSKVCVWFFHGVSRFPWTHSSGGMTMASHGRKSLPAATQKTTPPSYRRRLGPSDCFLRFFDPFRSGVKLPDLQTLLASLSRPLLSISLQAPTQGISCASKKISWNSISPAFYIIHENWAAGFLAEPGARARTCPCVSRNFILHDRSGSNSNTVITFNAFSLPLRVNACCVFCWLIRATQISNLDLNATKYQIAATVSLINE